MVEVLQHMASNLNSNEMPEKREIQQVVDFGCVHQQTPIWDVVTGTYLDLLNPEKLLWQI